MEATRELRALLEKTAVSSEWIKARVEPYIKTMFERIGQSKIDPHTSTEFFDRSVGNILNAYNKAVPHSPLQSVHELPFLNRALLSPEAAKHVQSRLDVLDPFMKALRNNPPTPVANIFRR